jgi:hypothetical protein
MKFQNGQIQRRLLDPYTSQPQAVDVLYLPSLEMPQHQP